MSKIAKHTPGEWKVEPLNSAGVYRITSRDGHHLSPLLETTGSLEEDKANADLAAASPDLLAALKGIMHYATMGASVTDVYTSEQPQFVNAYAAIAKAEGK